MSLATVLTDRFDRALLYATHVHGGQVRKGTSTPYVAHLLAVAATVLEYGGDEDCKIVSKRDPVGKERSLWILQVNPDPGWGNVSREHDPAAFSFFLSDINPLGGFRGGANVPRAFTGHGRAGPGADPTMCRHWCCPPPRRRELPRGRVRTDSHRHARCLSRA